MKRSTATNPFEALRSIKKAKAAKPVAAKKSPAKVAIAAAIEEEPALEMLETIMKAEEEKDRIVRRLFEPIEGVNVVSNDKGLSLVALSPGEMMPFQGHVLVCPIRGSFTVNGYTFSASKQGFTAANTTSLRFFPVFSPKSSSLLVFESVKSWIPLKEPTFVDETRQNNIIGTIKQLYSRLGEQEKYAATIIAFKSMNQSGIMDLEKRFPVYKELFTHVPLLELNKVNPLRLEGFHLVLEPNHPHPVLEIPPSWANIGVDIAAYNTRPVVCVVGSKGLGKSTFARFMVNQLLSKYPKVGFLDCDLGQPELTVSGQVSLHVLDTPILGPAFTNMRQPVYSCYLGATSPKNDPDGYNSSITHLWNMFSAQFSQSMPLVINTDGWVKGMGFDLLLHSLQQIRPTHLIQLSLDPASPLAPSKNIRDDLSALLNSKNSLLSVVNVIHALGYDETTARPSKLNAADFRNLAIVSHFAQTKMNPSEPLWISQANQCIHRLWNFGVTIAAKIPYSVPWHAVKLRFLYIEVPLSQTLIALNGSLIGLAVDTSKYSSTKELQVDSSFKDLSLVATDLQIPPQFQNCVGVGIIRAIDPITKTFFVVTPLHLELLAPVNLFVRGPGVDYPVSMLLDGFENVRTNIPFLSFTTAEGIGGVAKKVRTNLQRRKHI